MNLSLIVYLSKNGNAGNLNAGSGLDADLLDGQDSAYYRNASNLNAGTLPAARLPAFSGGDVTSSAGSDALSIAAATVLAKLKTVDGVGSGLDADLLQGKSVEELGGGDSGFTFVVDSDDALAAWAENADGNDYTSVLIKAKNANGDPWVYTYSGTAGTGSVPVGAIDISGGRTKYIFGEPNSQIRVETAINYVAAIKGPLTGTYPNFATITPDQFSMEGVKVYCNSTAPYSYGFRSCSNLTNCYGTCTGTGSGYGFGSCTNLTNCTGSGTCTGTGSGYGFNSCTNLTNCIGTGTGTGTGSGYGFGSCTNLTNCIGTGTGREGYGFYGCTNLANCTGTGTATASGNINGAGFSSCTTLTNCTGTGTANNSGDGFVACVFVSLCIGYGTGTSGLSCGFSSCTTLTNCAGYGTGVTGSGYGFNSCTNLTNCIGTGTSSGSGYGFSSCKGMVLNKKGSTASKTATFNSNCYVSISGSGTAPADTAAGGWNLP